MSSDIKFNIYGLAFGKPGPIGIGGVLRDGEGKVLCMLSLFVGVKDSNAAKILAIHKAVDLCSSVSACVGRNLVIESDSKIVVYWINSKGIGNANHVQLIFDIRNKLKFLGDELFAFSVLLLLLLFRLVFIFGFIFVLLGFSAPVVGRGFGQMNTKRTRSLSMTDYLTKKKSIIDSLQYSGNIISEDDKDMNILNGFKPQYDPFVIPVTSLPGCYSLPEITVLLLAHKARLDKHQQVENLTVNMASNSQNFFGLEEEIQEVLMEIIEGIF
ncbi:hypothetical protein Ddye_026604 [Dipteronia dyeriana]|uniref:RNase H type-1 domain-containing protein n=1 Tax=Dipteronia dyeriana TaxID=168575 RepID=A0AAD9TNG1_9ROSI|nr:hypothetical protein Ddye_026604 [Dipteronia dyeriana]